MNNQKNKKERTRIVSEEDMRQNVLKSGLVNELMSGVLDENGELPIIEAKGVPQAVQGENMQMGGEVQGMAQNAESQMPPDEEFEKYFENCRANCTQDQTTMDSLLLKIYDLILQKNKLVQVILEMQNTQGQNTQMQGGGMQMQSGQMGSQRAQRPQMRYAQTQSGNMPMSTGSTRQTMKKRDFIPKSQVEKMTREEIREVFDLIDKSRKEW